MSRLPETGALDLELEDGWLTIWFNQPEIRNPLTNERVNDLFAVCKAIHNRRDIRGVTFRGQGGIFCAGGDLKAFRTAFHGSATREDVVKLSLSGAALFDVINALPQVTIMAIEGAAMAGGFGLACVGDMVIADVEARFCLSETMIGLTPAQISAFVLQRMGPRKGRRVMLLASTMKGVEAVEAGLVDILAEGPQSMDSEIDRIKAQVMRCAPGAVAATKNLILALPNLTREEQKQMAAETFAESMMSEEGREGIASFFEKRKPNWAED